ncbi:MAG: S41 family peptidase [Planctomycetota bacterium]
MMVCKYKKGIAYVMLFLLYAALLTAGCQVSLPVEKQTAAVLDLNSPVEQGRYGSKADLGASEISVDIGKIEQVNEPAALVQGALPDTEQAGEIKPDTTAESIDVAVVAAKIYKGNFDEALQEVSGTGSQALWDIISEYKAIDRRRNEAKQKKYQEQLTKLEAIDLRDFSYDVNNIVAVLSASIKNRLEGFKITEEANEVDVNNLVENMEAIIEAKLRRVPIDAAAESIRLDDVAQVLAAIINTYAYADEQQKADLLKRPITIWAVEKALQKSSEFESKGQWLEAYFIYRQLLNLYEDNKSYEEYSEKLRQKALIESSLQDSACETWQQRYNKVHKELFEWALRRLDAGYVSIIDYRQMAVEAIERCKLLAEVLVFADTWETDFPAICADLVPVWRTELDKITEKMQASPSGVTKDNFTALFAEILQLNKSTAAIPEEILIAQFSGTALEYLDPYTNIIWPVQVEEFSKSMTNEFTGIGIHIQKDKPDGPLQVVSLIPGTPAYNSSLDAGDVIEAVDGVSMRSKDMPIGCAVQRITGPAGTKVTLTVKHQGQEKTEDITITRAVIVVPTIRGWRRDAQGNWQYLIDEENRIGYIGITGFTGTTSEDFENVLQKLEAEGLLALVLDLRDNSGGYLDTAKDIADKFIDEGLIVSTQPRQGGFPNYMVAKKRGTHPNYPLVVLINQYSASASEIVAGALQDKTHRRAILIGERTFGKGSVQTIVDYPQGAGRLKYTMAYYHLPSGQRVESSYAMRKLGREDWGVAPDVTIELTADEYVKMRSIQRDNDVLAKTGTDNHVEQSRHALEETLEADPQLAVATLVLKTKLLETGAVYSKAEF